MIFKILKWIKEAIQTDKYKIINKEDLKKSPYPQKKSQIELLNISISVHLENHKDFNLNGYRFQETNSEVYMVRKRLRLVNTILKKYKV